MSVDPHDDDPRFGFESPLPRGAAHALTALELVAVVLVAWAALAAAIVLAGLFAAVAVELFNIGWGLVR